MTKRRFALAGVLVAASILIVLAVPEFRTAREASRESALKSLEQQIIIEIWEYTRLHGKSPRELGELTIDFRRTDGADAEMLRCFRFEALVDGYRLRRTPSCPE